MASANNMYLGALIFLVGICIGSFLNVVIFRTHEKRSFVRGRSRCPVCQSKLKASELIPIVSFLLLGGRCRSCASKISLQYPLVEFVTGLLFFLFYLRYAQHFALPDYVTPANWWISMVRDLVFVCTLMVVFIYDLKYVQILDRFTMPAIIVALAFNLVLGYEPQAMLYGGGVLGLFFLVQFVVSRGTWVGGGDVRMGALMGVMLGLRDGLIALFIAYALGAIFGLILLGTRRADWKTQLPFGTFLAVGTLTVLLVGKPLLYWYLGLFV